MQLRFYHLVTSVRILPVPSRAEIRRKQHFIYVLHLAHPRAHAMRATNLPIPPPPPRNESRTRGQLYPSALT